ncbi:MAG: cysteine--tRNA ligase [Candidatus Altiarchaeota archaeon]|nr:cysteine--tRNA ligase [Candidatus Altiarchaeota archaeon]
MDTIKLFNTLTRNLEDFKPIKKGEVSMYVCGPTPYDKSHVGHARTYIFFDFLRRYLEYQKNEVKLIINLTDIDDKIINAAKKEDSWQVVPDVYTRYFFWMLDKLKIKMPYTFPHVTTHMQEIIELIQDLLNKNYVYKIENGLYFDISKQKDYGKLSKVNLNDPKIGRIEENKNKKNPGDFAVWKFKKKGEPFWYAPFGDGRPGWHIECSAMSSTYFGDKFDIHGGGVDLVFPHHENEIAQSEASIGGPWVNNWVHVAYLTISKAKMSKSLGNFVGIDQLLDSFSPEILRYYLLSAHYRTQLDFTWDKMKKAREQWTKVARAWYDVLQRDEQKLYGDVDLSKEIQMEFDKSLVALENDLKTPEAYKNIHFIASLVLANDLDEKSNSITLKALKTLDEIFAFLPEKSWTKKEYRLATELAELRQELRTEEKFTMSDLIRDNLKEEGISIEDTKEGPKVKFDI